MSACFSAGFLQKLRLSSRHFEIATSGVSAENCRQSFLRNELYKPNQGALAVPTSRENEARKSFSVMNACLATTILRELRLSPGLENQPFRNFPWRSVRGVFKAKLAYLRLSTPTPCPPLWRCPGQPWDPQTAKKRIPQRIRCERCDSSCDVEQNDGDSLSIWQGRNDDLNRF